MTGGRLEAGSEPLAGAALDALESQRSWWTRAHLFAEVARLTDAPVRESIELDVERIAERCVVLEVDDDDTYAQLDRQEMTSPRIIAAEQFVLGEADRCADWTIEARPDPKLAAKKELRHLLRSIDDGKPIADGNLTLGALLTEWDSKVLAGRDISGSTLMRHRWAWGSCGRNSAAPASAR